MRIFIADHELKVRSALCTLLRQRPGIEVVGEAATVEELLARVGASQPDLLLLHWRLGQGMPSLLASLKRECPGLKVIVLSARQEACREALAAGAEAFVCKMDPPEKLLAAIERIQCGDSRSNEEWPEWQGQCYGTAVRQPAAEGKREARGRLKLTGFGGGNPEPAPQSGT